MEKYLVAIRSGRHDLSAIKNLEDQRKDKILPLISVRGTSFQDFDSFMDDWKDRELLLDISRQPKDLKEPRSQPEKPKKENMIIKHGLNNPANAFEQKQIFLQSQIDKNPNIVPVIGWKASDPTRDITRCAIELSQDGKKKIAIRIAVNKKGEPTNHSKEILSTLLNSIPSPENSILIYDYQHIDERPATNEESWIYKQLDSIKSEYNIAGAYLLSTSFPKDRPDNGKVNYAACLDWEWQAQLRSTFDFLGYGDYGTSDPEGEMEFIIGMPTIPYAAYFSEQDLMWWTKKEGKDKEFNKYIKIAREVVSLNFFHEPELCWATKKYDAISKLNDNAQSGYGNNAVWLGYRINQHICAMLKLIGPNGTGEIDEDDLEF